jgi:dynein heavy chain
MVTGICKLLENIMLHNEVRALEQLFVFACIWCIGGGYIEKDGKDYKREFSNWWKDKWKVIKFPGKGTVFDYFVDLEANKLEDWSKMSGQDMSTIIDTSKSIASYTIPTVDTLSA